MTLDNMSELREKLLREVIIMNSKATVEPNNYYSYEIKLQDDALDGIMQLIAKEVIDGQIELLRQVNTFKAGENASNDTIAQHVSDTLTELQNKRKDLNE